MLIDFLAWFEEYKFNRLIEKVLTKTFGVIIIPIITDGEKDFKIISRGYSDADLAEILSHVSLSFPKQQNMVDEANDLLND